MTFGRESGRVPSVLRGSGHLRITGGRTRLRLGSVRHVARSGYSNRDRLVSPGQWQVVWDTFCLLSTADEVSIRPGEVLETSQFISAAIAGDATGWTTPIDGTYRFRAYIRSAREIMSTDGWIGIASSPFLVATNGA